MFFIAYFLAGMLPLDIAYDAMEHGFPEGKEFNQDLVERVLSAFTDSRSDCVFYPEVVAYLGSCHIWSVMQRLHHLERTRRRQGYDFSSHLREVGDITSSDLALQFLSIGFLVPEIGYECIFKKFSTKSPGVKISITELLQAIEDPGSLINRGPSSTRNVLKRFEAHSSSMGTPDRLLEKYDEALEIALEKAFNLFDVNHSGEVATSDLERIICCVGRKVDPVDLLDLINKLDPRDRGTIRGDPFMDVMLSYLRDNYDKYKAKSLSQMGEFFDRLDRNGDGTLDYAEFRHVLRSSGCSLTDVEVRSLLQLLDADMDGRVNYSEFMKIFSIMDDSKLAAKIPHNIQVGSILNLSLLID